MRWRSVDRFLFRTPLLLAWLLLAACAPGTLSRPGEPAPDQGRPDIPVQPALDASAGADLRPTADNATPDAPPPDAAPAADTAPPDLAPPDKGPPTTTSCTALAHIGDSLTYYTQPGLLAAYATVGATAQINAGGGRAILQKLSDDPMTGKQAATAIRQSGFSGCWVVALGTNDTANVAAGAWYTRGEAIDEMMTAIDPAGKADVMWVNTFTEKTSGYWANSNMVLWNQALLAAKSRWPKLTIFDWAKIAATGAAPYADGIHHTSAGYSVRNSAIANAVLNRYPAP